MPAEITYPLCVVKGRKSNRTELSNASEYWKTDVVFEIRDTTAALAERSLTAVVAVFGAAFGTAVTAPQSRVVILSIRAVDEDNKQEREQVEVASAAYRITWSKPREERELARLVMGAKIVSHVAEFRREMMATIAARVQAAGEFFAAACQETVGEPGPPPSEPGEPPRLESGTGQAAIVAEFNGDEDDPVSRVGVMSAGAYMAMLAAGTATVEPREWVQATLERVQGELADIIANG